MRSCENQGTGHPNSTFLEIRSIMDENILGVPDPTRKKKAHARGNHRHCRRATKSLSEDPLARQRTALPGCGAQRNFPQVPCLLPPPFTTAFEVSP